MSIYGANQVSDVEKGLDGYAVNDSRPGSSVMQEVFSASVAESSQAPFSARPLRIAEKSHSDILSLARQKLPAAAQTPYIFSILEKIAPYWDPDKLISKILQRLPSHAFSILYPSDLDRLEAFLDTIDEQIQEMLNLPGSLERADVIEILKSVHELSLEKIFSTIRFFPKYLKTSDVLKIFFDLLKSGEKLNDLTISLLIHAILYLPKSLRTPEISTMLLQANYSAFDLAVAIVLLPKSLRTPETFARLLEDVQNSVAIALALQDVSETEPELEKKDLMDRHSTLSEYRGSFRGPSGRGWVHQFQFKEAFNLPAAQSEEEKKSIQMTYDNAQDALFPAPEGPVLGSALPNVSSAGMERLVGFILGEESSEGSLFDRCKKVRERLKAEFDVSVLDLSQRAAEAKNHLEIFEKCFTLWLIHELGFSYDKSKGTWTVPDIEELRYGLSRLEIPINIGEVENITSSEKYLQAVIENDLDVVIGQFAHDHWIHMYSQLIKYLTEPSPGEYAKEAKEMRGIVKTILDALNKYKNSEEMNPEKEKLCDFFVALLSIYVDLISASPYYENELNIYRQFIESFSRFISDAFPGEAKDLKGFWDRFIPFAQNLMDNYVEEGPMKELILSGSSIFIPGLVQTAKKLS